MAKNIKELIEKANNLIENGFTHDSVEYKSWYDECDLFLSRKFGEDSIELRKFHSIRWQSGVYVINNGMNARMLTDFQNGVKQAINLLENFADDEDPSIPCQMEDFSKVLIVYGHNGEIRERVCRLLEKQGIQPIVLCEEVSVGKTIIEKFEKVSNCSAAICIFSPDDEGKEKNEENLKMRARQNVVFETGYCIGHIGRDKTIILADNELELPSDLQGVIYTNISNFDFEILKQLKLIGYNIDLNKAI